MIKSQKNSVKSGEMIACNRELQRVRRDDRKSEESERDERQSGEMPESQ